MLPWTLRIHHPCEGLWALNLVDSRFKRFSVVFTSDNLYNLLVLCALDNAQLFLVSLRFRNFYPSLFAFANRWQFLKFWNVSDFDLFSPPSESSPCLFALCNLHRHSGISELAKFTKYFSLHHSQRRHYSGSLWFSNVWVNQSSTLSLILKFRNNFYFQSLAKLGLFCTFTDFDAYWLLSDVAKWTGLSWTLIRHWRLPNSVGCSQIF